MSGLSILKRLLMKQAMKESAPFQHEGIMSISKSLAGNVDTKIKRMVESAKRQGADLDNLSEQELKYMLEMNKPKGPTIGGHRVIDASSAEGKGITNDLFNMLDRQSGKNVIKTDFGKPFAEEVGSVDGTIKYLKTLEPMDAMKETNKVLKGDGRYKSLSKADRKKIADDESVTDHIFERDIPIDPEDMADGGVAGLLGERTGFRGGGADAGGKSSPGGGTFGGNVGGGNGGNARERYRTQQYTTPKTKTTPRGGEGGKTTITTTPVTTGGINNITNLQKFKNFLGKKTGYTQHNINNQKLRDALDDEEITEEQYKLMGGFDVAKNMPLGLGSNYKNVGTASGLYNAIKSGVSAFTNSPYAQYGDIGPLESIALNTQGAAGLGKKDQMMYDDIVSGKKFFNMADGGPARQNFKMGKRAFLKLMGGVGAGIAGLKSGLFGLSKGAGKKAITETVKQTAGSGTPPPYFFKLVEKIKALGDDAPKLAVKDREKVTTYKDYTLTEDVTTGEKTIQRQRPSDSDYYDGMFNEEAYMSYKPGKSQIDETTKGKTPPDEYTEDTSYIRATGSEAGDIFDTVDGIPDTVLEEAGEKIIEKKIKSSPLDKADGGRIGYNKGKLVKGIISLFKKKPKKPETVKSFLDKRQFLKSMVGNTEKNKKARDLKMLKEAAEKARKEGGFKFENVDIDKDIRPIFDKEIAKSLKKNRKLNATGGLANMLGE